MTTSEALLLAAFKSYTLLLDPNVTQCPQSPTVPNPLKSPHDVAAISWLPHGLQRSSSHLTGYSDPSVTSRATAILQSPHDVAAILQSPHGVTAASDEDRSASGPKSRPTTAADSGQMRDLGAPAGMFWMGRAAAGSCAYLALCVELEGGNAVVERMECCCDAIESGRVEKYRMLIR